MWWRFLVFCVLVTITLFVVLSCIHGRPVTHLFFHRCCEDNIENDKMIFEDFGNTNMLRERLIGEDIVFVDNSSFVSDEEVEEVIRVMRDKLNVHDPRSRVNVTLLELINDDGFNEDKALNEESGEFTTKRTINEGKALNEESGEFTTKRTINEEIKSEKLIVSTTEKSVNTKEGDSNITKHNVKDAIEKLKTLFNENVKAKDAIREIDAIVSNNVGYDPRLSVSDSKSGPGTVNSTIKSTTIENVTENENSTVKPEIKQAPPLDEMIMSDMQGNNESVEI